MFHYPKLFLFILCLSILSACGGGGGDSEDPPSGFIVNNAPSNSPNFNVIPINSSFEIPAEHEGVLSEGGRLYSLPEGALQTAVTVSGLDGELILGLGEEELFISSNDRFMFQSTFSNGTEVTTSIKAQPFGQDCSYAGGVSSGYTSKDSAIELEIICQDNGRPAPPIVEIVYSSSTQSISLEWLAAEDPDHSALDLSYKVYWSETKTLVENRTSNSYLTQKGVLNASIADLNIDTTYFVTVEALDPDDNASPLSRIASVKTLALENKYSDIPMHQISASNITVVNGLIEIPSASFATPPILGDIIVTQGDASALPKKITSIALNSSTYTFETEEVALVDIFDRLTISASLSSTSTLPVQIQPASTSAVTQRVMSSSYGATNVGLIIGDETGVSIDPAPFPYSGFCRAIELTGDTSFLGQAIPVLNYEIAPDYDIGLTYDEEADSVGGFIEMKIKAKLSIEAKLDIQDSFSIKVVCKASTLPLNLFEKIIPVPVFGVPLPLLKAKIDYDQSYAFEFSVSEGLKAGVSVTPTATASTRIDINGETLDYLFTNTANAGYTYKTNLTHALSSEARLSGTPALKFGLSDNLGLSVGGDISLGLDMGANIDIDGRLLEEGSPELILAESPYLLEEFSIDKDAKLKLGGKLDLFKKLIIKAPSLSSDPFKKGTILNTPVICSNNASEKEKCQTQKVMSDSSMGEAIELEVSIFDGVRNKANLGTLKWKSVPEDGYLIVDEEDNQKVSFVPGVERAYTVIASVDDSVFGNLGRKYAQFAIPGKCQYGLGKKLGSEYDQYWVDGMIGYRFPDDITFDEDVNPFNETCKFIVDSPKSDIFIDISTSESLSDGNCPVVYSRSFYKGQLNGVSSQSPKQCSAFWYKSGRNYDTPSSERYLADFDKNKTIEFIFDKGRLVKASTQNWQGLGKIPENKIDRLGFVNITYQPVENIEGYEFSPLGEVVRAVFTPPDGEGRSIEKTISCIGDNEEANKLAVIPKNVLWQRRNYIDKYEKSTIDVLYSLDFDYRKDRHTLKKVNLNSGLTLSEYVLALSDRKSIGSGVWLGLGNIPENTRLAYNHNFINPISGEIEGPLVWIRDTESALNFGVCTPFLDSSIISYKHYYWEGPFVGKLWGSYNIYNNIGLGCGLKRKDGEIVSSVFNIEYYLKEGEPLIYGCEVVSL